MRTNARGSCFAQFLQCVGQKLWHLSNWCHTTTTASASFASFFDLWNCVGFFLDDGLVRILFYQPTVHKNN